MCVVSRRAAEDDGSPDNLVVNPGGQDSMIAGDPNTRRDRRAGLAIEGCVPASTSWAQWLRPDGEGNRVTGERQTTFRDAWSRARKGPPVAGIGGP